MNDGQIRSLSSRVQSLCARTYVRVCLMSRQTKRKVSDAEYRRGSNEKNNRRIDLVFFLSFVLFSIIVSALKVNNSKSPLQYHHHRRSTGKKRTRKRKEDDEVEEKKNDAQGNNVDLSVSLIVCVCSSY